MNVTATSRPPDPFERRIEAAFAPGRFIAYGAAYPFVEALRSIETDIASLVATEPSRAVGLYETFLGGCYEKANEIDDSNANLSGFAASLLCGWIQARQAAGADSDETAARLLARMDRDPFGFCYRIERQVARVLDEAGLAAFVRRIRARFDSCGGAAPTADESVRHNPEYARRHWGDALRTLYLAQRDRSAYLEVAEATGFTAQDCHAVATLLVAHGELDEALGWTDRGTALAESTDRSTGARLDLQRLRRELLTKLGRAGEALASAWAEYQKYPSTYSYDDLMMHVPAAEQDPWRARALEAAGSAGLRTRLDLLLHAGEPERLAALVRGSADAALEDVTHYATERAAKALESTHPDAAARLWRAQALRILNAKKSKYYAAALDNFRCARQCYEKAGRAEDWWRLVSEVRDAHYRKKGFLAGFEAVVAGAPPRREPSFLERARARWGDGDQDDT